MLILTCTAYRKGVVSCKHGTYPEIEHTPSVIIYRDSKGSGLPFWVTYTIWGVDIKPTYRSCFLTLNTYSVSGYTVPTFPRELVNYERIVIMEQHIVCLCCGILQRTASHRKGACKVVSRNGSVSYGYVTLLYKYWYVRRGFAVSGLLRKGIILMWLPIYMPCICL